MLSVNFYNINLFKTENQDIVENFFSILQLGVCNEAQKVCLYVLFTSQKNTIDLFYAKPRVIIQIRHYNHLAFGRKKTQKIG